VGDNKKLKLQMLPWSMLLDKNKQTTPNAAHWWLLFLPRHHQHQLYKQQHLINKEVNKWRENLKTELKKKLVKLRNLSFMYDELWIKRSVTWDNEKKSKKNLLPPQHFREINQKTKPKTILIPVIQKNR